jgi:ParB family chromosome partitioning protein
MLPTDRAKLRALPLKEVFPNPNQPRKHFDQDKLEELAMSIKAYGVQEPIKVVPVSANKVEAPEGGLYMIVMGERRWRASVLAGMETIPALVQYMTDAEIEELSLLENLQREDLSIIEEARAFQALLDKGNTVEVLAKKLGYKQSWRITERTSLLSLAPDFQDMVLKGHIGHSEAFEMSRVSGEEQIIVFRKIKDGTLSTYEKLRAFVSGLLDKAVQEALFEIPELDEEEKKALTAYERSMERVSAFLNRSIRENELTVLRKVLTANRAQNIQRIELMVKDLNKIRKALVQDELQASAAREKAMAGAAA